MIEKLAPRFGFTHLTVAYITPAEICKDLAGLRPRKASWMWKVRGFSGRRCLGCFGEQDTSREG